MLKAVQTLRLVLLYVVGFNVHVGVGISPSCEESSDTLSGTTEHKNYGTTVTTTHWCSPNMVKKFGSL